MILTRILENARLSPESIAFSFTKDASDSKETITRAKFVVHICDVAESIRKAASPGQRGLLLLQPSVEYVVSFFACIAAGIIPVPAYPPRNNRQTERLLSIASGAAASLVLADARAANRLATINDRRFREIPILNVSLREQNDSRQLPGAFNEVSPYAFIQYTSGSTSDPKGVVIDHDNLLSNLEVLAELLDWPKAPHVGVSWLPPYHDMGLVGGIIFPLACGFPVHLMSPFTFLRNPFRWLDMISREKATVSSSPNFGYDLCAQKIDDARKARLDLSSWRYAISGAEKVRGETIERFSRKFEPVGFKKSSFTPCYGLAEATLLVSGRRSSDPLVTACIDQVENPTVGFVGEVVSCGRPAGNVTLRVVDEDGGDCRDGKIGEILLSGPGISSGYWRAASIERLTNSNLKVAPEFRTGDLGCLIQGELFVTGRKKEIIILRGRNYFPQDIEKVAAESCAFLSTSAIAAFSVSDQEEALAIVAEVERGELFDEEIVENAIRTAVAETFEINCAELRLVRQGQIPRTSSGKIQRARCRDLLYLRPTRRSHETNVDNIGGTPESEPVFADAQRHGATARLVEMLKIWREVFPDAKLGPDSNFFAIGGDSLKAVELESAASRRDVVIDLEKIYANPTPATLAEAAPGEISAIKVDRAPDRSAFPLSPPQRRYWADYALESPGHSWSNVCRTFLILRQDVKKLPQAFRILCERHDSLRLQFVNVKNEWLMRCVDEVAVKITVVQTDVETQDSVWERILNKEANQNFDLSAPPLFQVKLLDCGESQLKGVLTIHHLVADASSLQILEEELTRLLAKQTPSSTVLPAKKYGYLDYAHWLNCYRNSETWLCDKAYWLNKLRDLPEPCISDERRHRARGHWKGDSCQLLIERDEASWESRLADERVSLFSFLLACKFIALASVFRRRDLIIGTPAQGRNRPEFQNAVGLFINQTPIRTVVRRELSCWEFVRQVQGDLMGALSHQLFQTDEALSELNLARDPDAFPFTSIFMSSLEFGYVARELEIHQGVGFKRLNQDVRFDMMTYVMKYKDITYLDCKFRESIFERGAILSMMKQIRRTMEVFLSASPNTSVGDALSAAVV